MLQVLLFGVVRGVQFVSANALTYADVPADRLSRSTSLGAVAQQLTVSIGVALAATILGLLSSTHAVPGAGQFQAAFVTVAAVVLGSALGYSSLVPGDGSTVSRHRARSQLACAIPLSGPSAHDGAGIAVTTEERTHG